MPESYVSRQLRRVTPSGSEHGGEVVWEGMVLVFDLEGHPSAQVAYAWSDSVPGTDNRHFYAVLHAGPVDSPEKAVRAAIVSEYRQASEER